MGEVISFALLGLGAGAIYALTAQGLVLSYRGSGIVNFAHGAIGMVGAFAFYMLRDNDGVPTVVALVVGIAISAAIGAAAQLLVMRRLANRSMVVRVVATLGLLLLLQGIIHQYWENPSLILPLSPLPVKSVTILGATIGQDRLWLVLVAGIVTTGLAVVYRYTKFGLATSAVSENPLAASIVGQAPLLIATVNWALGGALAAVGAIFIVPILGLTTAGLTFLVVPALAAALLGRLHSFGLALLGGLIIGISESELGRYVSSPPGLGDAVPFLLIIVILAVRGGGVEPRSAIVQRLPNLGNGRIRLVPAVSSLALIIVLVQWVLSPNWVAAVGMTFAAAVILLSFVVVTGMAGQISLAQMALAGSGAFIAAHVVEIVGGSLAVALIVGAVGAIPVGVIAALPALRARDVNLAIATLGLAEILFDVVFNAQQWTGGYTGLPIGKVTLFGLDVRELYHGNRYAYVCLGTFALLALGVTNLRRGVAGRRLIAVRSNQRAAAALGVSVPGAKLFAFSFGAAIAGVGGVLLSFTGNFVSFTGFDVSSSINALADAVIGGIGAVMGSVVGGQLAPGTVGTQLANTLGVNGYVTIFAGAILLLLQLRNPDGVVMELARQTRSIERAAVKVVHRPESSRQESWVPRGAASETRAPEPAASSVVQVRNATVRFGGVTAVSEVSLELRSGKIVGLIGPNGAGKSTLIDAITGFVRLSSGDILLNGRDITRMSARNRSRAGVARTFQSLELFEDMTVLENLRVACDPDSTLHYYRDIVHPFTPPLSAMAEAAIHEFKLSDELDRRPMELPYGHRRLLALARAVAAEPSVLLLDEPAAGLSDEETAELGQLIRRLASQWNLAMLLVEHDVDLVMGVCDHVVALNFGRFLCEGEPGVISRDPALVAAYLGDPGNRSDAPESLMENS
jgi:sulfate-transporting ATPase